MFIISKLYAQNSTIPILTTSVPKFQKGSNFTSKVLAAYLVLSGYDRKKYRFSSHTYRKILCNQHQYKKGLFSSHMHVDKLTQSLQTTKKKIYICFEILPFNNR